MAVNGVKFVQRSMNPELVKLSTGLVKYETTTVFGTGGDDYPVRMFAAGKDFDFIVNYDEDCFIEDTDAISDIVEYMKENGIASVGMPDGGVHERDWNPLVHNMFFTIYNVKLIREDNPEFEGSMLKCNRFKHEWAESRILPENGNYHFDKEEQYYYLGYYLLEHGLFLKDLDWSAGPDGETELRWDDQVFLRHAWYSRYFNYKGIVGETKRDEHERILRVYQRAKDNQH